MVCKSFTTLTRGKPEVILVVTERIYADLSALALADPSGGVSRFATTVSME